MPVEARFTGILEQESKHILGCLLQDFRTRGLGADALEDGYIGVSIEELKKKSLSNDGTTAVDFDLALKELEDHKLIKTGPMEMYENTPDSVVLILASYSKREYAYLTAKGYKTAR